MNLEFYIDIYFLINFTMNVILLFFTKRISKRTTKLRRILMSATFGALCACIATIFDPFPILISILVKYFLVSLTMVFIAFRFGSRTNFIHTYLVFLIGSFLFGGVMQSVFVNLGAKDYLYNSTMTFLVVISLLLTPLIYYGYHVLRESHQVASQLYDIIMYFNDEDTISCKGFMDTGNCLKDPMRGWPVIVVDRHLLSEIFMKFQNNRPEAICVIPYVSVGKEHGLLYGIRMEKVMIMKQQEEVCTRNVVAALSEHGFLNTKEYRALLHCDLLGIETK